MLVEGERRQKGRRGIQVKDNYVAEVVERGEQGIKRNMNNRKHGEEVIEMETREEIKK